MPLITEASQAKQLALEALNHAKENNHIKYAETLDQSKKHLLQAHKKQTDLLSDQARSEEVDLTIYLVHAMDHVTNAGLILDMVKELSELHMKITNKS
jgi:cellobiose PTS system EIIA component